MANERIPGELVVVIVLSLVGFFLLFGAFVSNSTKKADNVHAFTLKSITEDKIIDDRELKELSGLSCAEIKGLLGTDRNVCIYIKDMNGELVSLGDRIGIGCPGLKINGARVCG